MENPMTRRQTQIPGTERPDFPEIEKAAAAYCAVRDERCELSRREKQKKVELLAVMKAHKQDRYKFYDEKRETYLLARIDEGDPQVSVVDTGEADLPVGQGISSPGDDPAVPKGLIAMAEQAQADAGVEENSEGDVIVPDTAAPKGKAKKKAKKS
jgi:hypothetical protein